MRWACALLLMACSSAWGLSFTGDVVDQAGKPVEGAEIGNTGDAAEHVTDAMGLFRVETNAPAVVIRKAGYRSVLLHTGAVGRMHVVLETLPAPVRKGCKPGEVRLTITGPDSVFQFRNVEGIRAGKPGGEDEFHTRGYFLGDSADQGILHGAGVKWSSGPPLDRDVWNSDEFEEIVYDAPPYGTIYDSRGKFRDGTRWRSIGRMGESARSADVEEAPAGVLDKFLDQVCFSKVKRPVSGVRPRAKRKK